MATMWRGYFSSWDALENEVNESKSGSICIVTVCWGTKYVRAITGVPWVPETFLARFPVSVKSS